MIIRRKSILSGKVHEMDIPVTEQQLLDWMSGKGLIQNIMPDLSASQREFLMSGITPVEWESIFGREEEP